MFYTIINNPIYGKYLFFLLKEFNLATMNIGSAVPSLTTEILNNLEITMPSDDVLKRFNDVATPLFERMEANVEETQTLTTLRDSLLPKLMKGEIAV